MNKVRLMLSYVLLLLFYAVLIPLLAVRLGKQLDVWLEFPPLSLGWGNFALGFSILGAGLFWIGWSFVSLRKRGRGHPLEVFNVELAPATRRLVISGPYRYTRNPMCLGITTTIMGIGVLVRSYSAALISSALYLGLATLYLKSFEERGLIRRFGEEYLLYRSRVPMVIPRIRLRSRPRRQEAYEP